MTYSFPWAQKGVGDNLSGGGGNSEADGLVLLGLLLSNDAFEDILEDLVETELSEALSGISNEGWGPSLHDK
jgi:hypothetical protein